MLLRKSLGVLIAAGVVSCVAGSIASAGTFDPTISVLEGGLGGLPRLTLTGRSAGVATL